MKPQLLTIILLLILGQMDYAQTAGDKMNMAGEKISNNECCSTYPDTGYTGLLPYFNLTNDSINKQIMESKDSPAIGGAFYWFNWQKISDGGERFYGKYIYKTVLKWLSPRNTGSQKITCMIMDGDFLSSTKLDPRIAVTDPVMSEVVRQGTDEMYIIAIKGDENFDYSNLDSYLKKTMEKGYIGMVETPQMDNKEFYKMGTAMVLIFSIEIDGSYLKKIDFGLISDPVLEEMGFRLSK